MRYLSLFSGIEAASVAWEPLGWEPVAFCEIDAFPSAVLAYRYPNVPNLGDITEVDWDGFEERYGTVDLIVGGSPCQSFSIAGGREGLDGESRLMYEYIRAVREVRPAWFLWENVPGVFSTDAGRAFGILLHEMDGLGYGLAWRVLDAQFVRVADRDGDGRITGWFGPVAQRRRRVFLVGYLGDMRAAAVLFEPDSVRGNTQTSREKREELARTARERAAGCLSFAQNTRDEVRIVNGDGQISGALSANPGMKQTSYVVALQSDGSTSQKGNGCGYQDDGSAYTLNSVDRQSVMCVSSNAANAAVEDDMAGTLLSGGGSPPWIASAPCWRGITRESATSTSTRGS